ncbi:MAG: hypothetical protein ACLQPD_25760 [Desulfomonilaceae bacterium]
MKQYRFVTMTHHHVFAETLDGAIEAFRNMEKKGLPPAVHMVSRIEVEEEKGHYTSVDHRLRAREL